MAGAARDASGARFVAIARAAPGGRGVSFISVDGPAETASYLAGESFAPIWRKALEERRSICEHLRSAGLRRDDRASLRRHGIESVIAIPLEGLHGVSVGMLVAGLPPGMDSHGVRAELEHYAPLALLGLVEEDRARRAGVNERWLAAMADTLECGVLLVESGGRLRLASPRLASLLGLDPSILPDLSTFDDLLAAVRGNLHQPGEAEARWREIQRRGDEAAWDEVEMVRPAPRLLERFAHSVEDTDGSPLGWMEIYRDATGERAKRARLAQIEKLAALGQLISSIAHELNNPLTSIVGFAQLLLSAPSRDSAVAGRGHEAGLILAEAQRAGAIVRNLLLFAREEVPQRKAVRLNEVVERTIALRQYDLRLQNIQVELDLDPSQPVVEADPQAMQQLVLNLLINAEQAVATPQRTGLGRIEIHTRYTAEGGRVRLEVRDDGPGIPPENLGRIFDPFFTTKPTDVGTGLGLSIVNAIVHSHGGEVRAESEPGQGAAFIVELPAALEDAEPARPSRAVSVTPTAAPRPLAPARSRHKILVVEDEPTVAQLVADVLREEGHTVVAILDSVEALERLTREDFDLLICDLKMPRFDGRSLYESAVRRGGTGADRVLFITGDTLRPRTLEFVKQSGLPFLAKPFLVEELTRAVHAILDRQEPRAPQDAPSVRARAPLGGGN